MIEGAKSEPSLTLNLTGDSVDKFVSMMKKVRDGHPAELYYHEDFARNILIALGVNDYDEYR